MEAEDIARIPYWATASEYIEDLTYGIVIYVWTRYICLCAQSNRRKLHVINKFGISASRSFLVRDEKQLRFRQLVQISVPKA
jgi:hypothetical protein